MPTHMPGTAVARTVNAQPGQASATTQLADHRQEAAAQNRLQDMLNVSPQAMQLRALRDSVNQGSLMVAQRAVTAHRSVPLPLQAGVIQMMPEADHNRFNLLKVKFNAQLTRTFLAGLPPHNYRLGYVDTEPLWRDMINQRQSDSFSAADYLALDQRADVLIAQLAPEAVAATAVQQALAGFVALNQMDNAPTNLYEARRRYDTLVTDFAQHIEDGAIVPNQAALLAEIGWLTAHTVTRETFFNLDGVANAIDARQWQTYQVDVRNIVAGDAPAADIYAAFEARDPGWLGGQELVRLEEQLDHACETLEKDGWTAELEAAVATVTAALAAEASAQRQLARRAQLDAADAAAVAAAAAAAAAALSAGVLAARPQLPGDFQGVSWRQWNGAAGFQIPGSFNLVSLNGITVHFQSNMDVTAKHLREYLDQEVAAGGAADGPAALAYLQQMRGEFMQLSNPQINQTGKVRPAHWEFLFKPDENGIANRRTCYHIVPKSGAFHT